LEEREETFSPLVEELLDECFDEPLSAAVFVADVLEDLSVVLDGVFEDPLSAVFELDPLCDDFFFSLLIVRAR